MNIEYRVLEKYPEERFQELMDRNLHEQTVFFDLSETYQASDFPFESNPHKIKIGAYFNDELIGLSCGQAKSKNEFLMMISLVEDEFRNKGIYTSMLNKVLDLTESYDIIESHHHISNNPIIRIKLQNEFYISGYNINLYVGPTVILRKYNSEKLKEVFDYRVNKTSATPKL